MTVFVLMFVDSFVVCCLRAFAVAIWCLWFGQFDILFLWVVLPFVFTFVCGCEV